MRLRLRNADRKTKPIRHRPHQGHPVRFVHGHNGVGERNGRWRGGRYTIHGYVRVMAHGHPHANAAGYAFEHLVIASAALGKPIPEGAEVHHVNGVKSDNRNCNLVICQDHAYHALLHVRARQLERKRAA